MALEDGPDSQRAITYLEAFGQLDEATRAKLTTLVYLAKVYGVFDSGDVYPAPEEGDRSQRPEIVIARELADQIALALGRQPTALLRAVQVHIATFSPGNFVPSEELLRFHPDKKAAAEKAKQRQALAEARRAREVRYTVPTV